MIASRAPLRFARTGKDAAGCTCKDDPMMIKMRAFSVHSWACRIACSGIGWPNDTVADLRIPPQVSHLGDEKFPTSFLMISSGSKYFVQLKQTIFRFVP